MIGPVVVAAGGLGAGARFVVSEWAMRRTATERPLGTGVVNLLGAVALGAVVGSGISGASLAAMSGFLAGFTTYSTWMVESVALAAEGRAGASRALANLAGVYALGVALAWLGLIAGRTLL